MVWKHTWILGVDLVFNVGMSILSAVEAPGLRSRDVVCARRQQCLWVHRHARVDADSLKTNKNFVIFCGSLHWGWEEEKRSMCRGKSCFGAAASLPTEGEPPGLHVRDYQCQHRLHSFPCSHSAARQALLPPGVRFQAAEEHCHRRLC